MLLLLTKELLALILGVATIFSPFTRSSAFQYYQGDAPKINCGESAWQYSGYDMSGRTYTTCRAYTKNGHILHHYVGKTKDLIKPPPKEVKK